MKTSLLRMLDDPTKLLNIPSWIVMHETTQGSCIKQTSVCYIILQVSGHNGKVSQLKDQTSNYKLPQSGVCDNIS